MESLELGERTAIIDPAHLKLNEQMLNQYLETEAGYYDNFGACLATAERLLQLAELRAEKMFGLKFADYKDSMAGSDKINECRAKADPAVVACEEDVIDAKYKVKRLQQHLRAWDKNHDNAQSMGYMLRKQLDKLNNDIKQKQNSNSDYDSEFNRIGHIDDSEEKPEPQE